MAEKVTPISEIIKNVFARIEEGKTLSKDEVEAGWRELVGVDAARHTRLLTLRKGVLSVAVDSSSWMHEMSMRKRIFLKGLKRIFGKDKISEIHFKIGEI
ncbi:MAG: DUF721 domain-containing protein [Candidatus Omnitrophota bacterium]